MKQSCLTIGATGMLAEVTTYLAERCDTLAFTARRSQSIDRMSEALRNARARRVAIQLDWNDESAFLAKLAVHCDKHGYPNFTVAWLHGDSLGPKIATFLAQHVQPAVFYQVRGSAAARPGSDAKSIAARMQAIHGLEYRQVILGFKLNEHGSRWLSNSEISAGVIHAIESCESLSVIGTVEPWEMRP